MTNQLKKGIFATDIHFGKKSNSQQHNEDCIRFLTWFCDQVRADDSIDYVAFLGDWNENRSALNIATMKFSYEGAKMLNDLGLPVFFVVGNHDLYHRHSRDVHSVIPFQEFSNFQVIDTPTVIDDIVGGALFCPFLFHREYAELAQFSNIPFWAGHFEFKDFYVTGYGMKMQHGPDASLFAEPTHILSGHFHKRQVSSNVIYIGNTFPMDFGDAGDTDRGAVVYDHTTRTPTFINWPDCPTYTKTTVSKILDGVIEFAEGACVKCVVDERISYEESVLIKDKFSNTFKLREFTLEESMDLSEAMTDVDEELIELINSEEMSGASIDELVVQMLLSIESDTIDPTTLVDQYNNIRI